MVVRSPLIVLQLQHLFLILLLEEVPLPVVLPNAFHSNQVLHRPVFVEELQGGNPFVEDALDTLAEVDLVLLLNHHALQLVGLYDDTQLATEQEGTHHLVLLFGKSLQVEGTRNRFSFLTLFFAVVLVLTAVV